MAKKKKKLTVEVKKRVLEAKLAKVRREMERNATKATAAIAKVADVLAKNQAKEQKLVDALAAEIEVLPPVIVVEEPVPVV